MEVGLRGASYEATDVLDIPARRCDRIPFDVPIEHLRLNLPSGVTGLTVEIRSHP